jgi:prepilin-type N-terminal cleavage/methylation domain-containing protein
MMNMYTHIKKGRVSERGFTLLEMFIAIFIFSVTVVSFLQLTTRTIVRTRISTQQVVAQLLAQEGIELIEAKRNSNFMQHEVFPSVPWDDEIYEECDIDNGIGCIIHPFGGISAINDVGGADPRKCLVSCPPLLKNSQGLYNYAEGSETLYTRIISVDRWQINGLDDALIVTSRVEWLANNIPRSMEVSKTITNWFVGT